MTTGADVDTSLPVPRRRAVLALGSLLGSVALVALSLWCVDAREVGRQLASIDPRWLGAFFAVYVAQVLLLGARWSVIAQELGVPLGWRRASAEYALSLLVNSVLPSGFAGDGFRAIRHSQRCRELPLSRILEALALDRISGQLALWLVVLLSAPLSIQAGLVDPWPLLLVALGLGFGLWLARHLLRRASPSCNAALAVRALVGRVRPVLLEPRRIARHLPLSLLLTATLVLQLWMSARATGIFLDLGLMSWLGPLILVAASAPSFFGGWGVREAASALLFATAGLPGSAGVSVSLLFGAFSLASALPGALVMLFDAPTAPLPRPLGVTRSEQG